MCFANLIKLLNYQRNLLKMHIPKSFLRDSGEFVTRPRNLHFNSPLSPIFLTTLGENIELEELDF